MKRIAVLTSGGDGPGLNPCIRAVTRMAIHLGAEVIGVRRGYTGLMNGEVIELDRRAVGGIMGHVTRFVAGYALFRMSSDIEKLPFPLAPVAAQGATALAESGQAGRGIPAIGPGAHPR